MNEKSKPSRKNPDSIAAFDLDGTLISKNSSFAFCKFLAKEGFFSQIDLLFCIQCYFQHHFMNLSLWDLHQKIFGRLFKGRNIAELSEYLPAFLEEVLQKMWYPPAMEQLHTFQKNGSDIAIFSNSPRFLVEPIAALLNIELIEATDYAVDQEGRLLGIEALVDGEKKASLLLNKPGQETFAFSDSFLDLPFLLAAQNAVVVKPKRQLKRVALQKGWKII